MVNPMVKSFPWLQKGYEYIAAEQTEEKKFIIGNFRPVAVVKIDDDYLYDNISIQVSNSLAASMETSSTGACNDIKVTIPNEESDLLTRYDLDYSKIEAWFSYLGPEDIISMEEIIRADGTFETMTKLFTGYLYNIEPQVSIAGNTLSYVGKSSIFNYQDRTAKKRSYYGLFENVFEQFINHNNIPKQTSRETYLTVSENFKQLSGIDTTSLAPTDTILQSAIGRRLAFDTKGISNNAYLRFRVGDNESIFSVFDKMRRLGAHFSYVDENDVWTIKLLEELFIQPGQSVWMFEHGYNILQATVPTIKQKVNTVTVYYGRNIDPDGRKITVRNEELISRNNNKELVKEFVRRDINRENDAYRFAAGQLLSASRQNSIQLTIPLNPELRLSNIFYVDDPYLGVDSFFTVDGIIHTFDAQGAKTLIKGFATILSQMTASAIETKRKSFLPYSR